MLVLTRKCRESVAVGGRSDLEHMLKVTVLEICGGRVRLGFAGDVPVHRWEVWERIRAPGLAEPAAVGEEGSRARP